MQQVSPNHHVDMSPTRAQSNSLHASPHLLPLPPPAFSRQSSQSDASDGSDSTNNHYSARATDSSGASTSLHSFSPGASKPYSLQLSPTATSDTSRPPARNSLNLSNEDGQAVGEGESNGDFTQTFYDPFRIKHRRRTSPNQLKILEYHFEHNPKPDVTLRKALSEQLDMTPREVQVWFQNRRAKTKKLREKAEKEAGLLGAEDPRATSDNGFVGGGRRPSFGASLPMDSRLDGALPSLPALPPNMQAPDYLSLRRGSSPAILTSGLAGPNGSSYYEPPPMHRGHNVYAAPRQQQQPSFYSAHPNLPQPPLPPTSVYPSPMSVSASGLSTPSPNEQHQPFDYLQASPNRNGGEDPRGGGRRFSLPAYNSNYPMGPVDTHHQHQQQQQHSHQHQHQHQHQQQQQFPLPPAPSHYGNASSYASPPLDVQSILSEMNFVHINGYDAPREEGYSPPSSGEELPTTTTDFGGSSFPGSAAATRTNGQQAFPLSQYTFGGPSATTTTFGSGGQATPFDNLAQGGPPPMTSQALNYLNERRSSCPAGFIPTFDHLALTSPTAGHAYPPTSTAYDPSSSSSASATSPNLVLPPPQQPTPPINLQRRHSLAPTSPSYISTSPSSAGGFFHPGPTNSSPRRGSTSGLLGTISESTAGGGGERSARRVRSQRDLGPYGGRPSEPRRSPGGQGEGEWEPQLSVNGEPYVLA